MAGNAKEADIWFGRESAREARGKFKDLVCLVVLFCWIKRFVLLSLCLKCKCMNRYFSSFQKSRGGTIPPRKKSRGGHVPPVPPGIAAIVWHDIDPFLRNLCHFDPYLGTTVLGDNCLGNHAINFDPLSILSTISSFSGGLWRLGKMYVQYMDHTTVSWFLELGLLK